LRARATHFAAVIRSREQRDQLPLGKELVAVLNDLVGTADEVHVVLLEEARDNVGSKGERDTSVVLAPAGDVLVRVGPEEVAEKTCGVRNVPRRVT
jgi:hypothetical protein